MLQASWDRSDEQQQEQNSPNLGSTFFSRSTYVRINMRFYSALGCVNFAFWLPLPSGRGHTQPVLFIWLYFVPILTSYTCYFQERIPSSEQNREESENEVKFMEHETCCATHSVLHSGSSWRPFFLIILPLLRERANLLAE